MRSRLPVVVTMSATLSMLIIGAALAPMAAAENLSVARVHAVPAAPTVTSAEYPADGVLHDGVGKPGSFIITTGSGGTRAVRLGYQFFPPGQPTEPIGWLRLGASPGCDATSCTITKTPDLRGDWKLEVWAVDRAGRGSTRAIHRFRVSQPVAGLARWALNDPVGSSVLSEWNHSDGTNQATLVGTDFSLGHQARVGSDALRLNTDGDSGTHGYAETVTPIVDPAQSHVLSAWVKAAPGDRSAIIAGQEGTRTTALRLEQLPTGRWAVSGVSYDRDADNPVYRVESAEPIRPGQWTQLVGAYDATAKTIKLYIDGKLQGSTDFDADGWATAGLRAFTLGRGLSEGVKGGYFAGELDDVRVRDGEFTDSEVAGWYVPTVQARWRLNAPVGTNVTVADDTGAGHDLTLHGGAEIKDDQTCAAGTGPCLALDGAGTDGAGEWAQAGGPVIRTDESFTIAVSVYAPTVPTTPMTVFSVAGAEQSAFTVRFNPKVGKNPYYEPDFDPPSAEWIAGWEIEASDSDAASPVRTTAYHMQTCKVCTGEGPDHLALTYDASTATMTLYVNGTIEQTESNASFKSGVTAFQATGPLQIGRRLADGQAADTAASREYFAGLIDDVWVYKGALSAPQIATLNGLAEVDVFHGNPQLPAE